MTDAEEDEIRRVKHAYGWALVLKACPAVAVWGVAAYTEGLWRFLVCVLAASLTIRLFWAVVVVLAIFRSGRDS